VNRRRIDDEGVTTTLPEQPMRVIGAGFGRTGTTSLKLGLEKLGFGPCHHMKEILEHPDEVPTWERAARGEPIDWKTFMRPWGSACDFPSAFYYRELMEAFPDAKVILTTRDPASWYTSMSETIVPMLQRFPNRIIVPLLPVVSGPHRTMAGTRMYDEILLRFHEREHVLACYEAHIAEVKRVVPPERLLVFEAKQGWAPLCEFLGVPAPSEPFPRANDTAEFKRRVTAVTVLSWVLLLLPIAIVASLIAWLW
jgi:hypothetical protein